LISLDRYVILGGHRDSWVFGGIDPQSGAAAVHEIVRSFGKLKRRGNIMNEESTPKSLQCPLISLGFKHILKIKHKYLADVLNKHTTLQL